MVDAVGTSVGVTVRVTLALTDAFSASRTLQRDGRLVDAEDSLAGRDALSIRVGWRAEVDISAVVPSTTLTMEDIFTE